MSGAALLSNSMTVVYATIDTTTNIDAMIPIA